MSGRLDIRLNDTKVELGVTAEKEFYTTLVENDLSNPESREGSYTKQLKLPKTFNNLKLFGFPQLVGSHPAEVYQRYDVDVLVDGIPIRSGLEAVFSGYDNVSLFLTIVGDNTSLFDRIKLATIRDLQWADLNFTLDIAFIADHMGDPTPSDAWKDKLITPHLDYYDFDSQFNWEAVHPIDSPQEYTGIYNKRNSGFALYAKEIITRIMASAGYTMDFSGMNNTQFNNLVIICPIYKNLALSPADAISGYQKSNVDQTQSGIGEIHDALRLMFDIQINAPVSATWDDTNHWWEFTKSGIIAISLTGSVNYSSTSQPFDISYIGLYLNSGLVAQKQYIRGVDDATSLLELVVTGITVSPGDIVYAELYATSRSNGNTGDELTLVLSADFKLLEQTGADDDIIVSDWVPEMAQSKFVINMLTMFNFNIFTDNDNKVVHIEDFDNIFNRAPQDISRYIDAGRIPRVNYAFGKLAIVNYFDYTNDSDVSRRDTQGIFQSSNRILDTSVDYITIDGLSASDLSTFRPALSKTLKIRVPSFKLVQISATATRIAGDTTTTIFSFTDEAGALVKGGDFAEGDMVVLIDTPQTPSPYVIRTLTADKTQGTFYQLPNAAFDAGFEVWRVERGVDPSIRIAEIRVSELTRSIWDGSDSDTNQFVNNALEARFTNELRFNDIIATVYKKQLSMLDRVTTVKTWAIIPTAVIHEFRLNRLVYIDVYDAYFYVNRVNQWKPSQLTFLELIDVNVSTSGASLKGMKNRTGGDFSPLEFNKDFKLK